MFCTIAAYFVFAIQIKVLVLLLDANISKGIFDEYPKF